MFTFLHTMARPLSLPILSDTKPDRDNLPAGTCLCDYCRAKCCRYFALAIDTPEDWDDFDNIRWYLLHEYSAVFVEKDCWYLLISTKCKNLGDDNRCMDYDNRPLVCRDYSTDKCEYEDNWVYDQLWETPEQIFEYAEALLGPKKGDYIRTLPPRA